MANNFGYEIVCNLVCSMAVAFIIQSEDQAVHHCHHHRCRHHPHAQNFQESDTATTFSIAVVKKRMILSRQGHDHQPPTIIEVVLDLHVVLQLTVLIRLRILSLVRAVQAQLLDSMRVLGAQKF